MNDVISRKEATEVAEAVWSVTGDKNVAKVWDQIKDLPPTHCDNCPYLSQYPQQWIPVSERLPDKSNFYICTIADKLVKTVWYSVLYGSWEENVIAWMPLPEPYEGEVK